MRWCCLFRTTLGVSEERGADKNGESESAEHGIFMSPCDLPLLLGYLGVPTVFADIKVFVVSFAVAGTSAECRAVDVERQKVEAREDKQEAADSPCPSSVHLTSLC